MTLSQTQDDLEELQEKYDEVVRANTVLAAEKRALEADNAALRSQVHTLEHEFKRAEAGLGRLNSQAEIAQK